MTISRPHPYGLHLVEELHDRTPELHIHEFATRMERARVGDIVGIRISGDFDPDCAGITPRSETCLIRTGAGLAELPLDALEGRNRLAVDRYLRAQADYWGWMEEVDGVEPLRAELRPGNVGIDVYHFRDAIAAVTRPTADPLPLADLSGLSGMVAGLYVQDPATARRDKATRHTIEVLAEVLSGVTGLPADRTLVARLSQRVSGQQATSRTVAMPDTPTRDLT